MKPNEIREACDTAITATIELGLALEVLRDQKAFEPPAGTTVRGTKYVEIGLPTRRQGRRLWNELRADAADTEPLEWPSGLEPTGESLLGFPVYERKEVDLPGKSVIQSAKEKLEPEADKHDAVGPTVEKEIERSIEENLDWRDGPNLVAGTGVKPQQSAEERLALTFNECEACNAKTGSPLLCQPCLHNRTAISRLTDLLAEARGEE